MADAAEAPVVRIVEVGPRDGLQNVTQNISAATKIELISRLREAGLSTIEITSVVNRKVIPQLADREDVLRHDSVQALMAQPGVRAPVLVPNLRGLDIALEHDVKEVAVFVSASEAFSKANIRCSVDEGLQRAREVASKALASGMTVRGYISCIFECPFDGPTPQDVVLKCAQAMLDMGCYEISLGDTTGVGVPPMVLSLINYLKSNGIPETALAGHFHDTYGQAIANVWAAYMCGVRVFDSSVAGLGGCPYAPGAKGNLATEDLVYTMQQAGIDTGVDMASLVETGVWISSQLSVLNASRAGSAMATRAQSPVRDSMVESVPDYIPRSAPFQLEQNEQNVTSGRMTPPEEAGAKPDEHQQTCAPSPPKDSHFLLEEITMERLPDTPQSLSSGRSSPRRKQSRRLAARALYKYIGPRVGAAIPQRVHWRYHRRRRFTSSS